VEQPKEENIMVMKLPICGKPGIIASLAKED
jgi:hypothetical protein